MYSIYRYDTWIRSKSMHHYYVSLYWICDHYLNLLYISIDTTSRLYYWLIYYIYLDHWLYTKSILAPSFRAAEIDPAILHTRDTSGARPTDMDTWLCLGCHGWLNPLGIYIYIWVNRYTNWVSYKDVIYI